MTDRIGRYAARCWSSGPLGAVRRAVAAHPDLTALLIVVGLGTLLRILFFPRAPVFLSGDSYQYYRPAEGLITGEGFPLALKRPPLYPTFIALVARVLGEDLRYLAAVQHLIGLGTAALAYGVGRLSFGRGAGLVAGLVAALSGGLLLDEHYLMSETVFTFFLTLAVFLFLLGVRRDSNWAYAATGFVLGLATLTRIHIQILFPLIPLVVLLATQRWRTTLRAAALAGGAAALVMLPWMVRNYVAHDAFTTAARSGQSLIYLTALHYPGEFVFYDPDVPHDDDDPKIERASKIIQWRANEKAKNPSANILALTIHAQLMKDLDLTEGEANALMRDVAIQAIRARPLTYVRVVLDGFVRLLVGSPDELSRSWENYKSALRDRGNPIPARLKANAPPISAEQEAGYPFTERLLNIYQSPRLGWLIPGLLAVGLVAALVTPAWRPALFPGLAAIALHGISAAIVGAVSVRYHHPPDPLVHAVAAGGVLFLAQRAGAMLARLRGRAPSPAAPRVPSTAIR